MLLIYYTTRMIRTLMYCSNSLCRCTDYCRPARTWLEPGSRSDPLRSWLFVCVRRVNSQCTDLWWWNSREFHFSIAHFHNRWRWIWKRSRTIPVFIQSTHLKWIFSKNDFFFLVTYIFVGVVIVVGVVTRCSCVIRRRLLVVSSSLCRWVITTSRRRFVDSLAGCVVRSCWIGWTVISRCRWVGRCRVIRFDSCRVVWLGRRVIIRLLLIVTGLDRLDVLDWLNVLVTVRMNLNDPAKSQANL